jgi:hypothetical protein
VQEFGKVSTEILFKAIYTLVCRDTVAPRWMPAPVGEEYQSFLGQLDAAAAAIEARHGADWVAVVLIDELDAAIQKLPDDAFFQNLRNLLMVSRFSVHFRVVATGVKDLTNLVSTGSSPLNNLRVKALTVLSSTDARELVKRGGRQTPTPEWEGELFRLTGRHPYLLQGVLESLDLESTEIAELKRAAREFQKENKVFHRWLEMFGALGVLARRSASTGVVCVGCRRSRRSALGAQLPRRDR